MANTKRFQVKHGLRTKDIEFTDNSGASNEIIASFIDATDTLSFSGNSGQLFAITDSITGSIFTVNDISGMPSIEVKDTGDIILAETAGNVGIATATPAAKLHIVGQNPSGLIVENGSGIAPTQPYVSMAANNYSSGFGTFRWEDQRTSQTSPSFIWEVHDGSGTVLAYDFRTGATGAAGSKLAITQDGNVGIGTTTTGGYKLDVAGTARADSLTFRVDGSAPAGDAAIFRPAAGSIALATNSIERMRIDASGRVGIGTDSPTYKLHALVGAGAQNIFQAGQSGVSNGLSITSDGTNLTYSFLTGNVGIGTASPSAALSIFRETNTTNSATGTTLLNLTNDVGADINQQKTFVDFIFLDDNGNEYPQVRIGAEVGPNTNADSNEREGEGAFVVYTNNATGSGPAPTGLTEKMRVDYQGNVGIGTADPDVRLHVSSGDQLIARLGSTLTDASIIGVRLQGIDPSASNDTVFVDWFYDPENRKYGFGEGTTSGDLPINSGLSHADIVFDSGNVGIGTSSPSNTLEVASDADNSGITIYNDFTSGGRNARISFKSLNSYDASSVLAAITATPTSSANTSTSLVFQTSGDNSLASAGLTERMRITSAGNVGIGTTSPTNKFEVAGTQGQLFSVADSFTGTIFSVNDGSGVPSVEVMDTGDIYLAEFGGKVGIGTSAPARPLEISFASETFGLRLTRNDAVGNSLLEFANTSGVQNYIGHDAGLNAFVINNDGANTVVVTDSGDVGIGTGIPARLLELSNATASQSYLRISGNSGNVADANFAGIEFYNSDSSGVGPNVASFIEARAETSTGAGGELVFATSSSTDTEGARATERMRIDSVGKVGIGTASPLAGLHVNSNDVLLEPASGAVTGGDYSILVSGVDANINLLTPDDDSTVATNIVMGRYHHTTGNLIDRWGIVTNYDTGSQGSNTSNALTFNYGTSSNQIYDPSNQLVAITPAGNVGIGTSSIISGARLDVRGANANNLASLDAQVLTVQDTTSYAANVGGGIAFGYKFNSSGQSIQRGAVIKAVKENATDGDYSTSMAFATVANGGQTTEKMRIDPSGNVGIGTLANVDEILHVEKASGTTLVKTEVAAQSIVGFEIAKTGATTQSWRIVDGQTVNGVLEFHDLTNTATRMAIDGTGDVGIGTTTPTRKLDVNGYATATGFIAKNVATQTSGVSEFIARANNDNNTWMVGVSPSAGAQGSVNNVTWGLFWAGDGTTASNPPAFGTSGTHASNNGPGNIWGNAGNQNEFVFVGSNQSAWIVQGSDGHTWQRGDLWVDGTYYRGGQEFLAIQDAAPTGVDGNLWWESDTGKLKIYYNDGNTSQWVDAVPIPDTSTLYSKAGGTITGAVNIDSSLTTTGSAFIGGDVYANYSDSRLKNFTGTIESSLDKVKSLSGYLFTENEVAKQHGFDNDAQQVGVSAQEVQAVLPEAVALAPFDRDEETGASKSGENYLTVQYEKLVPLLIEAIKEQSATIEALTKRLEKLEG